MKKRILITGAFGFIGSHIISELSNFDIEILATDKFIPENCDNKIKTAILDLLDTNSMEKALKEFNPDCIIHLAGIACPTHKNVAELYNINVKGSENLLDAAQKFCKENTRVILTSTAGIYGSSDDVLYDEEKTPYNPQNHYSCSKMGMEFIAKRFQDYLDIKVVRPFNILGMNQKNNFLIPKLVEAFVSRQEVLRVGNLETERDFIDVEYTAKLFAQIALQNEVPHKIINICNGKATKGIDICNYLEEITAYRPKIEIAEEFLRKDEIMRMVGNPARCKEIMKNIAEPKSVKEILENMVQKYRKG